jgi:hypothetical protein
MNVPSPQQEKFFKITKEVGKCTLEDLNDEGLDLFQSFCEKHAQSEKKVQAFRKMIREVRAKRTKVDEQ